MTFDPGMSEWGNPRGAIPAPRTPNKIGVRGHTG